MKKGILLALGLGSFILGFVSVELLQENSSEMPAVKQAKVEEPITLSIPEAKLIEPKKIVKKIPAKKQKSQDGITLEIQIDDKSQRFQAYDNSLDNEVIDIMEEGRQLSSTKSPSTDLQHEIHHESTHLEIQ